MMKIEQKSKILYIGTPLFATVALNNIFDNGYNIIGVITQQDKRSGRGKKLKESAVKQLARKLSLPIYQPENKQALTQIIEKLQPDIVIVAAYGIIIDQEALDIPKYGFINIHGSILPKYRGASPISEAIISGEKKTGITLIKMNSGMDAGDIINKPTSIKIERDDTAESLTDKLAILGGKMILKTLPDIINGKIVLTKQNENLATYCKKIIKEDGRINWEEKAENIERKIRGYIPWPKSFMYINGSRYQILGAEILKTRDLRPGEISVKNKIFKIGTSDYDIEISLIRPENKRTISTRNWAANNQLIDGLIIE